MQRSTELHPLTARHLICAGALGPKVVVVVVVGSHKPQVLAQTSRTEATTPLIMCGEEGVQKARKKKGKRAGKGKKSEHIIRGIIQRGMRITCIWDGVWLVRRLHTVV